MSVLDQEEDVLETMENEKPRNAAKEKVSDASMLFLHKLQSYHSVTREYLKDSYLLIERIN